MATISMRMVYEIDVDGNDFADCILALLKKHPTMKFSVINAKLMSVDDMRVDGPTRNVDLSLNMDRERIGLAPLTDEELDAEFGGEDES